MPSGMRRLRTSLLALVLVVLCAAPAAARPGACASAHVAVSAATLHRAQSATLCLLNQIRAQAGLRPLRLNGRLSGAARGHSREMVRRHYFAHDSAHGTTPFARMFAAHYVPRNASWWLGENIAWGSSSLGQPAAIVRAWMHSPPHRANILSAHFRDIGIGVAPGIPAHSARLARQGGATYTTDFGSHS
jgi:uncharacterized protein YkwD